MKLMFTSSKEFQKFKQEFANRVEIDQDTLIAEILTLHKSRLSRNIVGEKRYSPKTLIDASLSDLSTRARFTELFVRLDINVSKMELLIKVITNYIVSEYGEELKAEYKTVGERNAYIDRKLAKYKRQIKEGQQVMEMLQAVIKDIDMGGYLLKTCIESLKLIDPKNNVV